MVRKKYTSVNEYLLDFPEKTRALLEELRAAIKKAAPQAKEVISYNMPAYKQNKVLVYFAGYKNHIGFYPTSSGIAYFQEELTNFKTSKGAVQFPLDQPLPLKLVEKIVKFRAVEDKS